MITFKLPHSLEPDDVSFIGSLQAKQSPMIRSAYASASCGLAELSVRGDLCDRFVASGLDSWFQQSAVVTGMGMFKADHKRGTPKRIFGGKKNLIRRAKGLITNEEWKQHRLMPVYIVGESLHKGNRKFDFRTDHVVFKPYKGKKINIALPKMKTNWSKLWFEAVNMAENKALPITVSLDQRYIYLTFDGAKVKQTLKSKPKAIKNRYAGIDMNPNYVGVSVFDGDRLIETELFNLSDLTGKNTNENKTNHETVEIGHAVGTWLQHLRVDKLFIEQLNFKSGGLGKGKNLNRLCKNQWKRTKLLSILKKYYPKLMEINAAYTSTIGNVLNPSLPDPVAASTEVAKRGYRLAIKKSKQVYPTLPTQQELEDRWKETEFPVVTSWKELHDFIKNTKLKYRVPIPAREGFRVFSSQSSMVGVL